MEVYSWQSFPNSLNLFPGSTGPPVKIRLGVLRSWRSLSASREVITQMGTMRVIHSLCPVAGALLGWQTRGAVPKHRPMSHDLLHVP